MSGLVGQQREVDENYAVFSKLLPDLMKKHSGQFLVMRHKEAVEFFDTARDAMIYATEKFDDGEFSVQEVTEQVVDLGWFSHASVHDTV